MRLAFGVQYLLQYELDKSESWAVIRAYVDTGQSTRLLRILQSLDHEYTDLWV